MSKKQIWKNPTGQVISGILLDTNTTYHIECVVTDNEGKILEIQARLKKDES